MAGPLAIFYTPMHFVWGVKSGTTPGVVYMTRCIDSIISPGRLSWTGRLGSNIV